MRGEGEKVKDAGGRREGKKEIVRECERERGKEEREERDTTHC